MLGRQAKALARVSSPPGHSAVQTPFPLHLVPPTFICRTQVRPRSLQDALEPQRKQSCHLLRVIRQQTELAKKAHGARADNWQPNSDGGELRAHPSYRIWTGISQLLLPCGSTSSPFTTRNQPLLHSTVTGEAKLPHFFFCRALPEGAVSYKVISHPTLGSISCHPLLSPEPTARHLAPPGVKGESFRGRRRRERLPTLHLFWRWYWCWGSLLDPRALR